MFLIKNGWDVIEQMSTSTKYLYYLEYSISNIDGKMLLTLINLINCYCPDFSSLHTEKEQIMLGIQFHLLAAITMPTLPAKNRLFIKPNGGMNV